MCQYMYVIYRCAHTELLAGPNCTFLLKQFSRIHQPEAWTPEGQQTLPFEWPNACLPGDHNTIPVPSDKWCGWECQNTFAPAQPTSNGITSFGGQVSPVTNSAVVATQAGWQGNKYQSAYHEYKPPSYHANDNGYMNQYDGASDVPGSYAFGAYPAVGAMDKSSAAPMELGATRMTTGGAMTDTDPILPSMETGTNMMGATGTLGMLGAQYGVPRIGVGWRDEKDEVKIIGDWWKDGDVFN
ncbi:hypothetical protein F5Y00DRAFT_266190 [Daldinia vernicosa]|uniref:uncharacterized protein n=1 Tax=Daldinia vernicosa TaxID=114800 RepID=UPI002007E787|nr:uncharacterized protein F5Y00DRAFT_266190 [Daldinia vernicosa]KAI0844869.1 hypothetical protein F5Y00DRAFT_266190 [Daldinia vernicosa]